MDYLLQLKTLLWLRGELVLQNNTEHTLKDGISTAWEGKLIISNLVSTMQLSFLSPFTTVDWDTALLTQQDLRYL